MTAVTCRLVLHKCRIPRFNSLYPVYFFTSSRTCRAGYKIQENLQDCYTLLNVSEGCSQEELRQAYLAKVKIYHPDSQSPTADSKKFNQVKEAYKAIKSRLDESDTLGQYYDDDDDDDVFNVKPMQAQHRQYLDNEGFGYGNRAQRQKQYEQLRVNKAQENVMKYRIRCIMPEGDNALVAKDQKAAKKTKISNTMDRLVEDMIVESMSQGHFDNLSGAGKPLDFSKDNPYMDRTTQKLNQILLDEDLLPNWISKQKEIRDDLQRCREKLAKDIKRCNECSNPKDKEEKMAAVTETFRTSLEDINIKIFNYNLIVPVLDKQMMPYYFDKEYKRVCSDIETYLPKGYDTSYHASPMTGYDPVQTVSFKDIWTGLKDIFRNSKKT
ncbi:dnaJ homolog subfamily C member 28-like [Mercenaria mercenaria]|uniref:dnaJ homolog subfamily C member 28-like n=1 Tax=Mercenaria mercenaria TaxID=6596 RepID=UPI00234E593E|nr:dnaJ homolog subfamily C member 28-like [Mercenaria mercenaria]XP_045168705.2 dnaJ homolog subfamily C member 28-like [Mercenaria mercenaria]